MSSNASTAGYSGTPLPRKLGVKPDSRVLVLGTPPALDLGVPVARRAGSGSYDVVLLFCRDRADLMRQFDRAAAAHTTTGMIWVCWPKRTSGRQTDLDENGVREYGLRHGRVDVKVAAVDAVWSALKFVIRLADR